MNLAFRVMEMQPNPTLYTGVNDLLQAFANNIILLGYFWVSQVLLPDRCHSILRLWHDGPSLPPAPLMIGEQCPRHWMSKP